jgi:hypothetical protein
VENSIIGIRETRIDCGLRNQTYAATSSENGVYRTTDLFGTVYRRHETALWPCVNQVLWGISMAAIRKYKALLSYGSEM